MRRLGIRIFIFFTKPIAYVFFSKQYLNGRFFDKSFGGWYWVWRSILTQKVFGFNRKVPWPVSPFIVISNHKNLIFHNDDLNNFQTFGCYFQNQDAKITLGKGVYIAPNVGLITSNHDPSNPEKHLPGKDVIIGDHSWIGMNSVILPGVTLGSTTVVGAGSVVTKSFPDGHCIIAGSPAKLIKRIEACG